MPIVIKVENLSKQYRLGQIGTGSIAHDANRLWHRLLGKEDPYLKVGETNDRSAKGNSKYVWSLRDINFEIHQGDAVGIIGRNGAGKSTILKILSRVTGPTTGVVKTKGRIASLLEVGTGFHPELSGRENIFLNGAILGMSKREIIRKFDEIVDFAGVERYIDTPVKRYSSGMYVRLAFGVAAHLDPEILIVDEVLAVGDAEFQKKCLGKMEDASKLGRTVLFVSHNMTAVSSLCQKAYLLEQGRIKFHGQTESAVRQYLEGNSGVINTNLYERSDRNGNGLLMVTDISVTSESGTTIIRTGDKININLSYTSKKPTRSARFLLRISDELNRPITFLDSEMAGFPGNLSQSGTVVCQTDHSFFTSGKCIINIAVMINGVLADQVKQAVEFIVEPADIFGTGKALTRSEGVYALKQNWRVAEASQNK